MASCRPAGSGGGTYRRGYEQIVERRRADFAKLDHVDVLEVRGHVPGQRFRRGELRRALQHGLSLARRQRHARAQRQRVLPRAPAGGRRRWTIVRNDDYQSRICYQ